MNSVRSAFLEMLSKNKKDLLNLLRLVEDETGTFHHHARVATHVFIISDDILVALVAYDELIQARRKLQFHTGLGSSVKQEAS